MSEATCGRKLIDAHVSVGETGDDFEFSPQCRHDLLQRRDLHITLILQLRQAGLLDAQDVSDLLLTLAGHQAELAEQ